MIDEVLQNLFAARGVRDFGMELQAVEFPFSIFDRGKIRALRLSGSEKTFWQRRYFVAVAVPNIELIAQAIEQLRAVGDLQHSRAVFAAARENDFTAEMMSHLHQSVTNSEHGNA